MKTYKIYISGTVQGVSFRQFIKEQADIIGVRGYVRNLSDGRVEVFAEGIDDKVNKFLEVCRVGYPHSKIKNVEVQETKHQDFRDFRIVRI
ncbi:MAG: hypothetical protein RL557_949 [archaeon]|jgi:acylphosphatase